MSNNFQQPLAQKLIFSPLSTKTTQKQVQTNKKIRILSEEEYSGYIHQGPGQDVSKQNQQVQQQQQLNIIPLQTNYQPIQMCTVGCPLEQVYIPWQTQLQMNEIINFEQKNIPPNSDYESIPIPLEQSAKCVICGGDNRQEYIIYTKCDCPNGFHIDCLFDQYLLDSQQNNFYYGNLICKGKNQEKPCQKIQKISDLKKIVNYSQEQRNDKHQTQSLLLKLNKIENALFLWQLSSFAGSYNSQHQQSQVTACINPQCKKVHSYFIYDRKRVNENIHQCIQCNHVQCLRCNKQLQFNTNCIECQ